MNALVPLNGAAPALFSGYTNLPDMNKAAQAGIQASFAVVSFKGKNWRIKHRGEETLVKDDRGNPAYSLDVVIVGISPAISKQWYDKKFTDGDHEAPDCFSIDGVSPDAASPKKQCSTCAVCPQNVWGSRVTEAGKKAKACQDSRRLAVVPAGDVTNAEMGGAILLRLPPTSLRNLDAYSRELARFNAQPFQVKTALSFDTAMAYPLITFKALGWVTDPQEASEIMDVVTDDLTARILNEEVVEATHDANGPEQSALAMGGPAAVAGQPAALVLAEPARVEPVVAATVVAPDPVVVVAAPSPVVVVETKPEPVAEAKPVEVKQAPADLNQAIDDLLSV